MKNNDNHLRLFVYGTLKKGFWNFDRFCTRAISIEPATTWGRLYQLSAGFPALEVPALEVPEISVLATGTTDPLADTRTQNTIELPENGMAQPEGDWDLVHGELMTFTNPGFDLPPIDRLEAFDPNGRCVYTRVLVAVESNDLIRPVWLYNYKLGHNMERIASGRWYPAE
jgi:gamma-glutamylcyclotransferase (GGCT)/AIG2-like uncharacterized protein YtfP